jgi:hypothetical protein
LNYFNMLAHFLLGLREGFVLNLRDREPMPSLSFSQAAIDRVARARCVTPA